MEFDDFERSVNFLEGFSYRSFKRDFRVDFGRANIKTECVESDRQERSKKHMVEKASGIAKRRIVKKNSAKLDPDNGTSSTEPSTDPSPEPSKESPKEPEKSPYDALALEKIHKAYAEVIAAETTEKQLRGELGTAKKEMLDEMTKLKTALKEAIEKSKGSPGAVALKKLNVIIGVNDRWDSRAKELGDEVTAAKEELDIAVKNLNNANGRLKEAITNSRQGDLFDKVNSQESSQN